MFNVQSFRFRWCVTMGIALTGTFVMCGAMLWTKGWHIGEGRFRCVEKRDGGFEESVSIWFDEGRFHHERILRRDDGTVFSTWKGSGPSIYKDDCDRIDAEDFSEGGTRIGHFRLRTKGGLHLVTLREWHPNGEPKTHARMREGQLDGMVREFHSNGQLCRESHWINGQRQGWVRFWDRDGESLGECWCEDNRGISGEYFAWHENGQLMSRTYSENGHSMIEWLWNDKGELLGIGEPLEGKEWDGLFFDDGGLEKDTVALFEDGQEIGRVTFDPSLSRDELMAQLKAKSETELASVRRASE